MRYYLTREMPLGNDCIFSYDRFIEKYNTDLANDLGNLVSRTIAMINKYFGGIVKKSEKQYFEVDKDIEELMAKVIDKYNDSFSNFRFQNGLNEVWSLIGRTNKYIDETAPWVLAKDENKKDELNDVMYHLYESIRNVAIMISPVVPETSEKILEYLNASDENKKYESLGYGKTLEAKVIEKAEVLFKRLDMEEEMKYHKAVQEEKEKANKKIEYKEEITIDDFAKLDLRVGEVLEAKKMEKSDKLLILKVKIENDVRQIVSGIANFYKPEEMVGKKVVVVANLKPVKLRGYDSEGMILAASSKDGLEVLEVLKEKSGAKVS